MNDNRFSLLLCSAKCTRVLLSTSRNKLEDQHKIHQKCGQGNNSHKNKLQPELQIEFIL